MQEFEKKTTTKESFMDDEDFKNTLVIAWMKCAYTMLHMEKLSPI